MSRIVADDPMVRSQPTRSEMSPDVTPPQRSGQEHARDQLLQMAGERGFVTLRDVARVITVGQDVDLDELRGSLQEAGFELIEATSKSDVEPRPLGLSADRVGAADEVSDEGALGAQLLRAGALAAEDLMPDSPAGIYLRDISRVPLLCAEQEVELAQTLERSDLAVSRLGDLTCAPDEQERCRAQVEAGSDARRRLTEANLRLVVSIARKYMGRGMPLLDMIQEGNMGLARAVEKYDYRKGFRFSTYAYWWIRQAITRAIADQSRTIRVPVHMIEMIGDVYKVSRDLQQGLGREPTAAEIARTMGTTPDRVRHILRAAKQPISLETPIGENEGSTIADFIADRSARAPSEAADAATLRDGVAGALMELSPRERQVLTMRFGLEDGRDRTLGEIGEELGVSRERVRQIEGMALNKLRRPRMRNRLREYMG